MTLIKWGATFQIFLLLILHSDCFNFIHFSGCTRLKNEIKKKRESSIDVDIYHSKVPSSEQFSRLDVNWTRKPCILDPVLKIYAHVYSSLNLCEMDALNGRDGGCLQLYETLF